MKHTERSITTTNTDNLGRLTDSLSPGN